MSLISKLESDIAWLVRGWVHRSPLSQCGMGSDTCPDWPIANEITDMIMPPVRSIIETYQSQMRELDATLDRELLATAPFHDPDGITRMPTDEFRVMFAVLRAALSDRHLTDGTRS